MKSKKGFTLIEIIAVISVLVIVITIFAVNMIKINNKNKNEEYQKYVNIITSSTDAYLAFNKDSIRDLSPDNEVYIKISDIKAAGYLLGDLKNPKTGKIIDDNEYVKVTLGKHDELIFTYPTEYIYLNITLDSSLTEPSIIATTNIKEWSYFEVINIDTGKIVERNEPKNHTEFSSSPILEEGIYQINIYLENGTLVKSSNKVNIKIKPEVLTKDCVENSIITYANMEWYVIKNNGNSCTLVLTKNYSAGKYGDTTDFSKSEIKEYLNTTFVSNTQLQNKINFGKLISQGQVNGNDYYVRIPTKDELSSNRPLSNDTNEKLFWTSTTLDNKLYLGGSNGSAQQAYFTDDKKVNETLWVNKYTSFSECRTVDCSCYYPALGKYCPTYSNSDNKSIIDNNAYVDINAKTLMANPNIEEQSFFNSSNNSNIKACTDTKFENVSAISCYKSYTSGTDYLIFGTITERDKFRIHPSANTGFYSSGSTSSWSSKTILYQSESDIKINEEKIYYAISKKACTSDWAGTYYADTTQESLELCTKDIAQTYYIPASSETSSKIGYRPVIEIKIN